MKKILSLGLVMVMVLIMSGCVTEEGETIVLYEDRVVFSLNGDSVVENTTSDVYIESNGFAAIYEGEDVSDHVTIEGDVINGLAGTYIITYTLSYETINMELIRVVVVSDDVDGIEFSLTGDIIIELTTIDIYVEAGFKAFDGDSDISSNVVVSGEVDMNNAGVYFLEYILTYNEEEFRLVRVISVTNDLLIANPDTILYDGTCDEVVVHFIDLEAMGDSTLIDCGDFEILIDAGTSGVGRDLVVPYLSEFVTDGIIELVIATHPDSDHFGGFVEDGVFGSFIVERILDFGYEKDTLIYAEYEYYRGIEGALVCSGSEALAGINMCQPYYTITEDLILTVIDTGNYDGLDSNHNENSIVVLLQHKDVTFLFTADAEFEAEEHMAAILGHVDIYKAGHHGSKTANSQVFLDAITPDTIIISVDFYDDKDDENRYYIPQQEAIDRLFGMTDDIYTTGTNGHIVITSNGTTYIIVGEENTILFKDSTWFAEHREYPTN